MPFGGNTGVWWWNLIQEIAAVQSRHESESKPISNVAEVPQATSSSSKSDDSNIAKVIWDVLSPNGKKKMKLNLSNSSEWGVNTAFRKKLGINLSNEVCVKSSQKDSNGGENWRIL